VSSGVIWLEDEPGLTSKGSLPLRYLSVQDGEYRPIPAKD
jgi:hypothetical protein